MATFTLHKDRLVECPFDKNHKIAVRNQIKHIIECEKKVGSKVSVCIYNASHRMARHEFAQHIKSCPDSRQFIREAHSSQQTYMSDNNPVIKAVVQTDQKDETASQNTYNTQTFDDHSEEGDCDNWDNDNCPHYSIYDTNTSADKKADSDIKTQKLTKNQKKRNRKKAAIASQQTKTIWD